MTNEAIAPDGGTRRETTKIAFRRPRPEDFADMTLMDPERAGPLRAGDQGYVAFAHAG